MKLYYFPGACSLSPHIVLREAGASFALERVDIATARTEHGRDFASINPKGYVPALELDDGAVLTEGAAILQFVADRYPAAGLATADTPLDRARLQEILNFIASELHKAFAPLFDPAAVAEAKAAAPARIGRHLDHIERSLADGRPYLLGQRFSVADAYLFAVARWTIPTGIRLAAWPRLAALVERVAARPAVQAALRAEGLIEGQA